MLPTEDQEILLGDEITDALLRVFKDELEYESILHLEGLIGITLDAGSPFHIQIQTTYYKEDDLGLDELDSIEESVISETLTPSPVKEVPSRQKNAQQILKVALSPIQHNQKGFKSTPAKLKKMTPKVKQEALKSASPAAADQAEADVPLLTSSSRSGRIRKPKRFDDCVVDFGSIKKYVKQEPGAKDEESPKPVASLTKTKSTPAEPLKKSGRGRPLKSREPEATPATPRKGSKEEETPATPKRGRGRPKKDETVDSKTSAKEAESPPVETPVEASTSKSPEKRKIKKTNVTDGALDGNLSLEESANLAWQAIMAGEMGDDKDQPADSDDDYVPSIGGFDHGQGDNAANDITNIPESLGSPILAEPTTSLGLGEDVEPVVIAPEQQEEEPEEPEEPESFKEVVSITHVLSMEDMAPEEEQTPENLIPKRKRGRPSGPWVRQPKPQPGERPFVCEHCGKAYTRKDHLRYHMMSHTGMQEEKKYACEWCGKRYVRLSQLNDHRRTHTGERPYQCHECGKSFKSNSALIKHKEVHLGMKNWNCDVCGKKFARKGGLVEHQLTHNKANYFHCDICGKGFPRKDRVEVHKRLHLGIRPYVCHLCGDGFTQSGHLRNHIKAHSKIKKRRRGVGIPPGSGAKRKSRGKIFPEGGEQTFILSGNQALNSTSINQAIHQVAQMESGMQMGGEDNTQIIFKTEDGTPFNMSDVAQDDNMQIIFKSGDDAQDLVSDENTQIIYITNAVLDENNQLVSMEGASGEPDGEEGEKMEITEMIEPKEDAANDVVEHLAVEPANDVVEHLAVEPANDVVDHLAVEPANDVVEHLAVEPANDVVEHLAVEPVAE